MQRNNSIDEVRLVASIVVLLIHVQISGIAGKIVTDVGRFAVPFFIMVSGYYCTPVSAKKQLILTGKLAMIGTIFYMVLNILLSLYKGNGFLSWLSNYLNIESLLLLLVLNRAHFLSNIMYYLFMMVYVYVIYIFLCRKNAIRIGYYVVPFLLFLSILFSIANLPWYFSGNWLFTGIPFFFLGNWMNEQGCKDFNASVLLVLGLGLSLVEALLTKDGMYISIGILLLSVGILLSCLQHPNGITGKLEFSRIGKQLATPIFLLHCGVRDIVKTFIQVDASKLPIIVLLITMVVSIATVFVKNWKDTVF